MRRRFKAGQVVAYHEDFVKITSATQESDGKLARWYYWVGWRGEDYYAHVGQRDLRLLTKKERGPVFGERVGR